MTPTCILHLGTHKTGTSSIQESLFHGLEDPRFRLVSLGRPNGSLFTEAVFSHEPEKFWLYRAKGYSPAKVRRLGRRFDARLRRALRRARAASATPIISAEQRWQGTEAEHERLRDLLADEGFEARVIVYVRPYRSFIASAFQEVQKVGDLFIRPPRSEGERWSMPRPNSFERLAALERVFGRERLVVRTFARKALVDGCVVRDFCQTLGIRIADASIVRVNESLSADALRMLYSFNRFARESARPGFQAAHMLVMRFDRLEGPALRIHPDAFAPMREEVERNDAALLERFGVDLREAASPADLDGAVRDESDLFRFGDASIEWLAAASGRAPVVGRDGEAVARQVAAQVALLARSPSLADRARWLRGGARDALRWIRRGD